MSSQSAQRAALTIFAVGVFMAGLDNGIVSSSLTTLIHAFGVTASWGAWIITIYTLGLAVSVPIMAKLSDRYGRKRMFLMAVALFGTGSLSVALSHTFGMMLVSRAFESLGAGGIFPIASGYIVATIPVERQGRALGMVGGMNGIAAVIGPNVGSLILGITGDWHWLFWINVPIAAVLLLVGRKRIPESRAVSQGRLDMGGILMLSAGVLSLMYGMTNLHGADLMQSLQSPAAYGFMLGGLALLAIFGVYEHKIDRRGRNTLVPMSLLRRPELRWTLAGGFASGLILASVIFLPAFVQTVLGWPSMESGYWFTPLALFSGVGAMGGGAFMDRRGPVVTLASGYGIAAIGALLFPMWVNSTWQMVLASSLLGLGIGITLGAPLNFLVTEHVSDDKSTALGFLSLVREIGLTLGPTIFAGFLTRSMMQFPSTFVSVAEKSRIAPGALKQAQIIASQMDSLGSASRAIRHISDPTVRAAVATAVHEVLKTGFGHLFWASGAIAALSVVSVARVGRYRQRLQQEHIPGEPSMANAER